MKNKPNIEQMSKRTPFTTPDGYFDQLTQRIMQQLPQSAPERPTSHRRIIWFFTTAAAACIVGALFFINFTPKSDSVQPAPPYIATGPEDLYDEQFSQEALNYALVDNSDIYYYLSGADM